MNNQTENNNPPAPLLPHELKILFSSLSPDMKPVFIKIYRHLWNYVNPLKGFRVLHAYWIVDLFRMHSALTVCTYLYFITSGGVIVVRSDAIYNGLVMPHLTTGSKQVLLNKLKRRGYITRSTWNPDEPYLSRSYHRQPVFIELSSKGVVLIKGIEKDIYNTFMHKSMDEITGTIR